MKRILQNFLLLFILLFAAKGSNATHMMGADMQYTCLGNGKYKIVFKIYRDCRGISLGGIGLNYYAGLAGGNGCGGGSIGGVKRTGIRDVSTRCTSASAPCGSPNTARQGKGVEEHTFEVTVDFTKAPLKNLVGKSSCCEVTFWAGQCCRNGAITTGAANNNFATTCMINLCNVAKAGDSCNSSPQLSNEPVGFLCCNTPWYYNNGAIDTIDFDSISYQLVPGLQSVPSNRISYSSPFSPQIPMTPFCIPVTTIKCTPKPNLDPPRGFFFDTTNGDIIVQPIDCDEVPILVIEQTEYRKDTTGKWVVVGKTRRDMQMWILDECGYNKPPKINGPFSWDVCEGDKICKKIKITDETFNPYQKTPDTVLANWNGGIPGATFEVVDPKKREKEYEFCWQTKRGQASDVSYSFTVKATDQHCTPPMISIRSFKVKVKPRAEAERHYDTLKCGRFAMTATLPANFQGKASHQWSVRDSSGQSELFFSTKRTDTMKFYKGGKYIFVHTVNNSANCPTVYYDTIDVPDPPTVELATGDTFACYGTDMELKPNILWGNDPYTLKWSRYQMDLDTLGGYVLSNKLHIDGDTNTTLLVKNITSDSAIEIQVTDEDGCIFYDTAIIFLKPLPVVDLGPDMRICTYETQMFDAQNNDTVDYNWSSGDTTQIVYFNEEDNYWVKVTERKWGCVQFDTVRLDVNDTVTSIAGPDLVICNEDITKLVADHRPVATTGSYVWTNLTQGQVLGTDMVYDVSPRNTNANGGGDQTFVYELYTKVTEGGHTCEDKDTMEILVHTLPVVKWSKNPLPAQCYDYGDILLNSFLNVGETAGVRIWGGSLYNPDNYVDSQTETRHLFLTSTLDNSLLQNGKNFREKIYGWYQDGNGCINKDSTVQIINGNPIIELISKTYCQDLGQVSMDNNVKRPATKTGITMDWVAKEVPAGVDSASVVQNMNPWGTPDWQFLFGDPTEDYYMGRYHYELCVTDILTQCRSCDTVSNIVIGEPTVKVLSPDPVCVNWDTINLNQYVTVNGQPATNGDGGWYEVPEVNFDRSHAKVGMTLTDGYMFPPGEGPGTFLIRYSNNGTGCLKTDSFYVFVNDTPDAVLLSPLTLCSSGPDLDLNTRIDMTQTRPTSGTATWTGQYVTGNKFTPTTTLTSNIEGPYNIKLAYTDGNGCADTEIYVLQVRTQPEIEITTVDPYPQCENSPFPVQSESKWSNNNVNWQVVNGSDGSIDDNTSENIVYTHGTGDAINKQAFLKVTTVPITNDVCPPVSDSIQIIIHPYPELEPLSTFNGCVPLITNWEVIETKGIPQSQLTYLWTFGNGDSSQLQYPNDITYPTQGKYTVNVTVTNNTPDGGTCATTITGIDNVEAYPNPTAYFETDPSFSTTVALPKFTMINKSSVEQIPFSPSLSYVWDFGTGNPDDTMMSENPRFAYSRDTGLYDITLYVTTSNGCKDTFTRKVHIGPDIIVFIPDVFTPDQQGPTQNERFNPVATNFKTFQMLIFNRWGEKLFETEDPNLGWDGNDQSGEPCQSGVYVYHVVITSFEDKEYVYNGTITLLR